MKQIHTYCRICEPACGLLAEVDGSNVTLKPDAEHPVHKGFACHKGLAFTEVHHDPDRLNYPQRRRNGKSSDAPAEFERVDWDFAVGDIASRLAGIRDSHGGEAIGFYTGNPSAFNSTGRLAAGQFAALMEARYRFGSGTQDCANKFAAAEAVYGTVNLHPIPDFKHTNYLLSLGANPRVSHMSFVHTTDPMKALRDIVARGGAVRHVNPRSIESATPATGDLIQIKPDTDVYFLAALIHEIVSENGPGKFVEHTERLAELFEFVARYPAERVASITGIDATTIRTIAHEFSTADGASVYMSTGVNMGRQGTLAYWLVQMLSLITGNLGVSGGNIYSPGYFPAATVGLRRKEDPFFDTEFGPMRTITGSLPGNLLADHIEAGKLKALICMSGNPLLSMAGEQRTAAALAKLDLIVVVDIYPNATSEYADYVLPATDWLERADINSVSLGFQPEPYVQFTDAVVEPIAERKPEWWIFSRLLQAMDLPSMLDNDADPMDRAERQLGRAGLSIEAIRSAPAQTIRLPDPAPSTLWEIGVQNPSGKIDCCPPLFTSALTDCETICRELESESVHQLKLITLRTNYMVNSWFHNVASMKRDHVLDNPLMINPADAERLGLGDGDPVHVRSGAGELLTTVKTDGSLRTGVVAMTHGWGHRSSPAMKVASNHPGVNVNRLLPSGPGSYETLSNQSHMTGIPVEVIAASAG